MDFGSLLASAGGIAAGWPCIQALPATTHMPVLLRLSQSLAKARVRANPGRGTS
jgi:hypothetical protein